MVSFSCDGCNETLKKQKVARHNCGSNSVSCIDCSVTFYGNDYVQHTSCVSEAQKYEKSLYREKKSKSGGNKRAPDQSNVHEPGKKRHRDSNDNNTVSEVVNHAQNGAGKDIVPGSTIKSSGEGVVCKAESGENSKGTSVKKQGRKSEKKRSDVDHESKECESKAGSDQKKSVGKEGVAENDNRVKVEEPVKIEDRSAEMNGDHDDQIKVVKEIICEILNQESGLSLGHVRKMTKKRARASAIRLTDPVFYSSLNALGAVIGPIRTQ